MPLQQTSPAENKSRKVSRPVTAHAVRDGFELLILRNAEVELAVAPGLGAKVVSLKNLRSGREWLWHPASGLKLFASQLGEDFSRGTLVGWDECLPTIAPCCWKGHALPDHGEAWTQAWEVDQAAWDKGILKTSVRLPVTGLKFTRTLSLREGAQGSARSAPGQATQEGRGLYAASPSEALRAPLLQRAPEPLTVKRPEGRVPVTASKCASSTLTVEYVLENPTDIAQDFVWAAHPLLAVQEGDRLELTDEIRAHLPGQPWLDTLEFPAGSAGCAKAYAGPLKLGRAGVVNPRTGDRLTFEWNPAECDTLGLWLTRGGWNGHHHLALEPATGAADSLADAVSQSKRPGLLPPHTTKTWRLQLLIES